MSQSPLTDWILLGLLSDPLKSCKDAFSCFYITGLEGLSNPGGRWAHGVTRACHQESQSNMFTHQRPLSYWSDRCTTWATADDHAENAQHVMAKRCIYITRRQKEPLKLQVLCLPALMKSPQSDTDQGHLNVAANLLCFTGVPFWRQPYHLMIIKVSIWIASIWCVW